MTDNDGPWIRNYIASGGIGWLIALVVLILCIAMYAFSLGRVATPVLVLVAALAVSRLL